MDPFDYIGKHVIANLDDNHRIVGHIVDAWEDDDEDIWFAVRDETTNEDDAFRISDVRELIPVVAYTEVPIM